MASFASQPLQFTQYVAPTSLEQEQMTQQAQTQVGLMKQQMYDTNVQKIQGVASTILGMQVMGEANQKYLQELQTKLKEDLRGTASADYSKASVVNSAMGLAAKVGNDKNVQAAVISTKRIQSYYDQMKEARKEGKSSLANDNYGLRNINKYLSSNTVGELLPEQSYIANYEYQGNFLKWVKERNPDIQITQNPFSTNTDGSPNWEATALINGKRTQLSESDVAGLFDSYVATDARAAQQIQIEGVYYSDTTPNEAFLQQTTAYYQDTLTALQRQKTEAEALTALTGNQAEENQQRIENLSAQILRTDESLKNFTSNFSSNPEATKASMYKNDLRNKVSKSFAYSQLETTVVSNPIFEAKLDLMNYNLASQKATWDREYQQQKIAVDRMKAEAEKAASGAGPAAFAEGGTTDVGTDPALVEQDVQSLGLESTRERMQVLYDSYMGSGLPNPIKIVGTDSRGQNIYEVVDKGVNVDQLFDKAMKENSQSEPLRDYLSDPFNTSYGIGKYNLYQTKKQAVSQVENTLRQEGLGRSYIGTPQENQIAGTVDGITVTKGEVERIFNSARTTPITGPSAAEDMSAATGIPANKIQAVLYAGDTFKNIVAPLESKYEAANNRRKELYKQNKLNSNQASLVWAEKTNPKTFAASSAVVRESIRLSPNEGKDMLEDWDEATSGDDGAISMYRDRASGKYYVVGVSTVKGKTKSTEPIEISEANALSAAGGNASKLGGDSYFGTKEMINIVKNTPGMEYPKTPMITPYAKNFKIFSGIGQDQSGRYFPIIEVLDHSTGKMLKFNTTGWARFSTVEEAATSLDIYKNMDDSHIRAQFNIPE